MLAVCLTVCPHAHSTVCCLCESCGFKIRHTRCTVFLRGLFTQESPVSEREVCFPNFCKVLCTFSFRGLFPKKSPEQKSASSQNPKDTEKMKHFGYKKRILSKPCSFVPATSVGTYWTGTVLEGPICGAFWTFLPQIPCHTDLKWTRIDFERFRSESIWSKSPFPLWTFLDVARIRSGPGMIFLKIDPSPLSLCHSTFRVGPITQYQNLCRISTSRD